MKPGRTMLDKIWDAHTVVGECEETPALLYVDLHLVHEVTSPQAFAALAERGQPVRRPDLTVATADHTVPTVRFAAFADAAAERQVESLDANCRKTGIRYFGPGDSRQGIVHVIGPEQGHTRPGMTIVCGDSHTSTHGAFGALAFGIGTSEVAHVLASQTLLQRKPKNMRVTFTGVLPRGVTAKDMALALIGQLGTGGGTGYVLEFAGPAVQALSMDGRMTLCNMAIEAGARAGMIAPDETTIAYLANTPGAKAAIADWTVATRRWTALASDDDAVFDREVRLDVGSLGPMITWGTAPDMVVQVDRAVPSPQGDASRAKALAYMAQDAEQALIGRPVQVVFIGSCTNGRIEDLRAAAGIFAGRRVPGGVRALIVPGSRAVHEQAEREGLAAIFLAAGAEWREPGCSLCIAMNGDRLAPGELAVSTSNRNFAGRQGPGGRTVLASPITAAAAAVTGYVADPRQFLE